MPDASSLFALPGMLMVEAPLVESNLDGLPAAVFFICLRETLETSIIVAILLAWLKQTIGPDKDKITYRKLQWQVRLS